MNLPPLLSSPLLEITIRFSLSSNILVCRWAGYRKRHTYLPNLNMPSYHDIFKVLLFLPLPPPPLLPHTYYNCFWCQCVWIPGSSVNHHLGYLKEKLKEEEQVWLGLCFVLGSLENIIHFKHGNKWIKIRVLWTIHFKSRENTSQDQRLRAKSRSIFSYTLHKSELWATIGKFWFMYIRIFLQTVSRARGSSTSV